ncbi:MAG: regulatory protein RecX, partial [Nitrospinales bacterium]
MPDADEINRAKKIAFRFLAYRDRTQEEIRRHLAKKEIPSSIIQETLIYLENLGYIDDQKFALNWGEARILSKRIGKRRLEQELLVKGIAASEVAKAVETLYAEREEWDLALACGRKKWAGLKGLD